MPAQSFDPYFGTAIVRAALIGAVIGVVAVLAVSGATIALTDQGLDLLGVAALAASFGGAGFGAMLGGVLTAVRVHANDEPGRAAP